MYNLIQLIYTQSPLRFDPCWHHPFLIAGQLTELLMNDGHSGTSENLYIKIPTLVAGSVLDRVVTHLRN